tara:strand:+ start:29 stop:706 length:678 start_codon:yes stop_codon:yes gene_type:complete
MFSYYGSKWRLSPKYPAPKYTTIIEPFAGSACYSLLYGKRNLFSLDVELYDINEKICLLWEYLISVTESEILQLPILQPNEKIPNSLPIEAQYLIGFWCTKGTTSPGYKMAATQRTDLGHWSTSIRKRIASQLQYIRHWSINHLCYKKIKNKKATWFVDPPYFLGGDRYTYSNIDYNFLGQWCKSRQGHVIVCENNKAKWLDFSVLHSTKGFRKNTTEVYWEKYD